MVIGGSLAGLMAALTLSRSGLQVTVLERSNPSPGTGGMLMIRSALIEQLTGTRRNDPALRSVTLASGAQTWGAIHDSLRRTAELDAAITLHHHARVLEADQDERSAWVVTDSGERFEADIVIGADGHRSVVRRAVAPEHPDAGYAGYLVWLGVIDESDLPRELRGDRRLNEGAFQIDDRDVLFGGVIPGAERSERQIGWAWYDAAHNAFLSEHGHVRGTVVHHSVKAHEITDEVYDNLTRMIRTSFRTPWREVMLTSIERRVITGTPIAEYVPERIVNGRLAIVGNAAHVPTPMTGSGFAESLEDAEALADAVTQGVQGTAAESALLDYERRRLDRARRVVESGRGFSRSFRGHRH